VTGRLRTVAVAVALGSFSYFVAISLARPFVGGDTPFVLDGSNAFLNCLSAHDYNACGYTGKLNFWGLMSPIGWWPLLQHIPDLITIGLGGDGHVARTRVLATLSVIGVVVSVGLGWLVLRRYRRTAVFWAFLLVALSGPVLAFARQTAGEMLAMGLLVGVVAAALLQAPPPVVALTALLACWTKETSYPFIAVLGVLGLVLARRQSGRPIRQHLLWGAGGMVVAIAAASLFNVVRFGSVLNVNYLDAQLRTPGIWHKVEYTVAIFVSPSGGLLFFWPAAVALVAAACFVGLKRDALPGTILLASTAVLAIGLASWWTPFGWSGYGPRLELPWVLPIVLLAIVAYGDALEPLLTRLLASPVRTFLVLAVVLACALPHIGYMWKFTSLDGYFQQENPPCNAPWRSADWYPCQDRLVWEDRPMPLYTVRGVSTFGGAATATLVGLGLLGCLLLLRGELVPARQQRPVTLRPASALPWQTRRMRRPQSP
jgi:hypothetical protein